jgi:S1-C subfamily serine protease
VADPSKTLAADLGITGVKGSYIPNIYRGSPADKSGILPGDYVTAINGKAIADTNNLVQTVGDLPAGETAAFDLIRDGQSVKRNVTIEPRAKDTELSRLKLWPGFLVTPVTQDIRDQLSLAPSLDGLIVAQVDDKSVGDVAGLKVSDVLKSINGKEVKTVREFYRALNGASGEVKLTFVREGVELSISVTR